MCKLSHELHIIYVPSGSRLGYECQSHPVLQFCWFSNVCLSFILVWPHISDIVQSNEPYVVHLVNGVYCQLICVGYDRPILKDLCNHVVPGVADKWRDLGVQLLDPISGSTLDIIERNNPRDVVRCCQCMLEKWLEKTPDASWNQLLAALRSSSVQLNHLASQIEQEFIPKCEI